MDNIINLAGGGGHDNQQSTAKERKASPPGSGGISERISQLVGGGGQKPAEEQKPVGFTDRVHGMLGGGRESEKKEDFLDKTVDFVQEHILGQGPQDNENAIEQAKDEAISDYIRRSYKSNTGRDFPVADK